MTTDAGPDYQCVVNEPNMIGTNKQKKIEPGKAYAIQINRKCMFRTFTFLAFQL